MNTVLMIRAVRGPDGGLENHFLRIATGLRSTAKVQLVFVLSAPYGVMFEHAESRGIPCYFIDVHNYKKLIPNLYRFLTICKEHQVDLVQSHMLPESIFGRFVRMLLPQTRHIFRVHTLVEGIPISNSRKRIYHLLNFLTSFGVDCYAPLSSWLVDELKSCSHISSGKIKIVTNGVDPAGPPDSLPEPTAGIHRCLAVVGRVRYDKGQHLVLEAISRLKKNGIEVVAEIFGAGESSGSFMRESENTYFQDLKLNVERGGIETQVRFHGQVDDVPSYLSNIPVLVLASYHEGISNAILEALSMKKIVVATAVGGTPDIIENGVNGFLFPKGDVEALTRILHEIYSKQAAEFNDIREAGYQTWQSRFSTPKMMNDLFLVYQELGLRIS